jgi:peptidoglycan/LPS O-acetylase OafA/YrhL
MLQQSSNKINYLEGVRGIAAFIVVLHHFGLAFYPAHYLLKNAEAHIGDGTIEKIMATTPLNFFVNGHMAVSIFFVLSGIVLSNRYFQTKNVEVLRGLAIKRYPRLMLPVLFATIVAYLAKLLGLMYCSKAALITTSDWLSELGNYDLNFWTMLKTTLFKVFFIGNNEYITVLWTMMIELRGSFMVFIFLFLFGKYRFRGVIYALSIGGLLFLNKSFSMAFILGILLADLMNSKPNILNKFKNPILNAVLLLIGLYLTSYPAAHNAHLDNIMYRYLPYHRLDFYHVLGATLLVFSIGYSEFLQKILSNKVPLFLGKISFSLYLIHPIIIASFSSFLISEFNNPIYYNYVVLFIFILTLIVAFILSYLMTIYVDKKSIELSSQFYRKIVKKWAK